MRQRGCAQRQFAHNQAFGGDAVLDALASSRGCGLLDRLTALQYGSDELSTLTLDRKMAAQPNVDRLAIRTAGR